jgi:hypothetical protein
MRESILGFFIAILGNKNCLDTNQLLILLAFCIRFLQPIKIFLLLNSTKDNYFSNLDFYVKIQALKAKEI